MNYILTNANVYYNNKISQLNVYIKDGIIAEIGSYFPDFTADKVFDLNNCFIFPGFTDVHVHFREPGFSYKETIYSGTMAAAHGGYTTVCTMPNLNPVPDSLENLDVQLKIIESDANIHVIPYGAVTCGEKGEILADMQAMAPYVAGFSDDGRGIQNEAMMKSAMAKTASLGKILAAHCEDNSLVCGGYIHKGKYAEIHGHRGICSESEWRQIERDIRLAEETGCKYHVCHISAKESVEIIREAKARGVDISCETGPHYLVLNDMNIQEDGRFKMNPPIRSEEDRKALLNGIVDGTVDMIATDHAPHAAEEKNKGLEKSLMGIVGLETAFPVLYTHLVKQGIISLEKLLELLHDNPNRRFNIGSEIAEGQPADITVFNLEDEYMINPENFKSKGKSTPFSGMKVYGKCIMTMFAGKIVWSDLY